MNSATLSTHTWWGRGGFGQLFAGQAVSAVGSQVTFMALPLIAVLNLRATPGAMGVLGALDNLPYLLLGLWIGGVVDRHARRRLMIASDLLRAIAVISVPVAFWFDCLTFAQLCTVAFIVGIGNIAFDVACQAHLPELVDEPHLVPANGALQTSTGLAAVGAPGLVGLCIKIVGAPVSMLIDAGSYLVSATCIGAIRTAEQPRPAPDPTSLPHPLDGVRIVIRDRRLRGLGGAAAMISISMNAIMAVLIFYLADAYHYGPVLIGLVFLSFGLGGAAGAMSAAALAARLGVGRMLTAGPALGAAGLLGIALADARSPGGTALLYASVVAAGLGIMVHQVLAAGLRQSLVTDTFRGRALAALRVLEWGTMPIGSLLGGMVGERFGSVPALVTAAVILLGSVAWVLLTPLGRLRHMPAAV